MSIHCPALKIPFLIQLYSWGSQALHIPRPGIRLWASWCVKSVFTTHHGWFEFHANANWLMQHTRHVPESDASCTCSLGMEKLNCLFGWHNYNCFLHPQRAFLSIFGRQSDVSLRLKCLFLHDEVPYLGHVISAKGICPGPAKLERWSLSPRHYNIITTLRQFIGLASYNHRFVPGFAKINCCASACADSHKQNYCISELETLDLIWAVWYFHLYLLGHCTVDLSLSP